MHRACSIFVIVAFAASLATGAGAADKCRDAKGKFVKCPTPAAAAAKPASATAGATTAASGGSGPVCKKGKRCGNACISVKDTCHK